MHRKIQFVKKHIDSSENSKDSIKLRQCKVFVCAAIMQDLLQSEFTKPITEQLPDRFNLYLNLLVDLALQENFIDRQLEKLILSATDLNVASDYYYLAANLLRLKVSCSDAIPQFSVTIAILDVAVSREYGHRPHQYWTHQRSLIPRKSQIL